MYRKSDKVISYIAKLISKLFRTVSSFDELNIISLSHEIYGEALQRIKREVARLVESVYNSTSEKHEMTEDEASGFVLALAAAYNPVTKYIFNNEVERRRSRFVEGVLSSKTPREEVALAKRLLIAIMKQFADDATFETVIEAYADDGVKEVQWITAKDDKRCAACKARDGKIYPIDAIPPKPHIHCRCYIKKVVYDHRAGALP